MTDALDGKFGDGNQRVGQRPFGPHDPEQRTLGVSNSIRQRGMAHGAAVPRLESTEPRWFSTKQSPIPSLPLQ